MDILTGAGLAAPAGLNAYIPLLTVGLLNRYTDLVTLSSPFDIISSDVGLIVLAILLLIELFADAVPGLDSVNDVIQTAIRPAAGAIVMLASDNEVVDMHPFLLALLGGGLAGLVHAVKSVGRPVVTVATGGLGNAAVSTGENVVSLILSILAVLAPVAVLIGGAALLVLAIRWLVLKRRRSIQP
jgi:hypothetical protein